MIIPPISVPAYAIGQMLIEDLFTRHTNGQGIEKFAAKIGHKVRWTFEWARDNAGSDLVIAEAANILVDRED